MQLQCNAHACRWGQLVSICTHSAKQYCTTAVLQPRLQPLTRGHHITVMICAVAQYQHMQPSSAQTRRARCFLASRTFSSNQLQVTAAYCCTAAAAMLHKQCCIVPSHALELLCMFDKQSCAVMSTATWRCICKVLPLLLSRKPQAMHAMTNMQQTHNAAQPNETIKHNSRGCAGCCCPITQLQC